MINPKSLTLFLIVFVLIYTIVSLIITPFLGFNFGANPSLIEKIFGFFIEHPFGNIKKLMKNFFLLTLVLNGIFWGCTVTGLILVIKRLMN